MNAALIGSRMFGFGRNKSILTGLGKCHLTLVMHVLNEMGCIDHDKLKSLGWHLDITFLVRFCPAGWLSWSDSVWRRINKPSLGRVEDKDGGWRAIQE